MNLVFFANLRKSFCLHLDQYVIFFCLKCFSVAIVVISLLILLLFSFILSSSYKVG